MALVLVILPAILFSQQEPPSKKNSRPGGQPASAQAESEARHAGSFDPVYTYKFGKEEFQVSRIVISHDEAGVGSITFEKKDFGEPITEELKLSPKSLEKVTKLWMNLDFLNSESEYQSAERDYSHLGTMTLTMRKGGKERTVELNWTDIPEVKALTEEYKRIGNQYVWIFDMDVARRNQPLETPRMVKKLDTYLRLNSISDAEQLLPYLNELSNDERLPLIARNHLLRITKDIEKRLAKK